MLEMLLVCSAIILVVMGLRLLFRRKVSGLLVYSLWLPAAAGLLLAPVVYLLAGAFSDLAAFAINNVPVIYLAGLLWLAGAAALTTWLILTGRELRKNLRKNAVSFSCPESPVPVWISPDITTPCLFGLIHPAIYLTPDVVADPERCRHVLAHELTHLHHADHIWSFVRRLCLCVYWFHPLMWLAVQLSRQDSELACDEGALKRLGDEQRLAYGKTIVELAAAASKKSLLEADGRKVWKLSAGQRKQRCLMTWGLALVACVALVAGLTLRLVDNPAAQPPAELKSVAVAQEPFRCHYVYGESLDTRGLELQLTYSDGTTRTVTEGFTCSPEKMEIIGKQTITVTYGQNVMKFDVDIGEASKTGTCGENLKWTLTKQGSLIITGTGAMTDYQQGKAPWSSAVVRAVSFAEGVTTIGAYAFADCGVQRVRTPDSMVSVGEGAFASCKHMTSCDFSANVTKIDKKAFYMCEGLERVTLPAGLVSIEEEAFYCCMKLEEIVFPSKLKSIGRAAFMFCDGIKQLTIPGSVETIKSYAFGNCSNLEQLQLQEGIVSIAVSAFSGTERIQEVFIPASVTELHIDAFERRSLRAIWVAPGSSKYETDEFGVLYTKGLKKLVLYPTAREGGYQVAQGCQIIGERAFAGCSIPQLTLPDTLRRIEPLAFHMCYGFSELVLPKSVSYVDASGILYSSIGKITFLNPQCQIDTKDYLVWYNTTVYGYKNSTAQQYARKLGFKFVEIT